MSLDLNIFYSAYIQYVKTVCASGGKELVTAIITVGVLALLISAMLTGLAVIYKYIFKSPNKVQNDIHHLPSWEQYQQKKAEITAKTDALNALPYEEVWIKSFDGHMLFGRYYHQKDGAPVNICFHGFRGTAVRDFCYAAEMVRNEGHNLLLVDQRAHGKSEGTCITYGIRESRDCMSWLDYTVKRFGNAVKIVLSGVSMGASTVLLAAGLDLPDNVKGIVADSPYTSPKAIMQIVSARSKLNKKAAFAMLWLAALVYGHFRLDRGDVIESVKKSRVPMIVFHGTGDSLIPYTMSEEIKAANPEKVYLHLTEGAEHAFSIVVDAESYVSHLREFFEKII